MVQALSLSIDNSLPDKVPWERNCNSENQLAYQSIPVGTDCTCEKKDFYPWKIVLYPGDKYVNMAIEESFDGHVH